MAPDLIYQNVPIYLKPLAESFHQWLNGQSYSSVFILTDSHTEKYCLPRFLPLHNTLLNAGSICLPAGERHKNLASCEKIWQLMLENNLDRKGLVVNLGGGMIGDIGGFCAASWKRGVDFVQIPTTLLAMTDAAIGGKTGIDFQGIKNAIGIFRQPAAIFIDPSFLNTLPEAEIRSGMAEVIKHAAIGDPHIFRLLPEKSIPEAGNVADWELLLKHSISVKLRIVEEDPHERGPRMLLNFGHTFGHALESFFLESTDPLSHGEAVYIGMLCEAQLQKGNRTLLEAIHQAGRRCFTHRTISPDLYPLLWERMRQDKKNSSGMVVCAIPDEKPYSMLLRSIHYAEMADCLNAYNAML